MTDDPARLSDGAIAWITRVGTEHPASNAGELMRWVRGRGPGGCNEDTAFQSRRDKMDKEKMAKAFNEWMRLFTEEPDRFEHEFQTVVAFHRDQAEGREPSYGAVCAAYLEKLSARL